MNKKSNRNLTIIFSVLLLLLLIAVDPGPSLAKAKLGILAQPPAGSALEAITDDCELRVGVKENFQPFSFIQNGERVGFDIDLAQEFAERWSTDACNIEVVLVPANPDNIIDRLIANDIHVIIGAMTQTWPREEQIDFSQVYFVDGQGLLVRSDSGVKTISDLNGKIVAVVSGTTACQLENVKLGCQSYQAQETAVEALLDKDFIEAFISDSITQAEIVAKYPARLKLVTEEFTQKPYIFTQEPYAIGVPQGDSRLRELINATLQAMKQDGTYDALYTKWFRDRIPEDISLTPGEPDFPEVGELGREYSKLELIQMRGGVLVAGVKCDLHPFGYVDDIGQHQGFDVELIRAMAKTWGVEPKFVCVTSANRIEKLLNNEVDIIAASMTHTWPRADSIVFSQTYFADGQSLLVRLDSDIAGLDDLSSLRVASLRGSTSIKNIEAEIKKRGLLIDGGQPIPYDSADVAVADLLSGKIDVFTSDSVILSEFEKQYPDRLDVVGGLFSSEPYGMGLPIGDYPFIDLVNCTLQKLYETNKYHEIYQDIFERNGNSNEAAAPYPVEVFPGEQTCDFEKVVSNLEIDEPDSMIDQILEGDQPLKVGILRSEEFDAAIAQELMSRWFENSDSYEFVEITVPDRIPALVSGRVDLLLAELTHNVARDQEIDYSQTYFEDRQGLLVRRDSGIETLADLDGQKVVTLNASTSLKNITRQQEVLGLDITIITVDTAEEAIDAVKSGEAAALTSDRLALKRYEDDDLVVTREAFGSEPYGIGLRQYDHRFQNLINATLQQMKQDGTYDALYCQWYPDTYSSRRLELWPGLTRTEYEGINIKRMGEPLENKCTDSETELPPETAGNATLYEVTSNDTLSTIAERFYGDLLLWETIYEDNLHIIGDNPGVIKEGMILVLRKDLLVNR